MTPIFSNERSSKYGNNIPIQIVSPADIIDLWHFLVFARSDELARRAARATAVIFVASR